jgi:hypothetical protein
VATSPTHLPSTTTITQPPHPWTTARPEDNPPRPRRENDTRRGIMMHDQYDLHKPCGSQMHAEIDLLTAYREH